MNFIVWIIVGGGMGWLASVVTRNGELARRVSVNVIVGLIGALIGGWLISPLVGARTIDDGALKGASLVWSLAGAVTLLVVIQSSRRRS